MLSRLFISNRLIAAGIFATLTLTTPPSQAGPLVDAATEAEKLADEGKQLDAVFAMDLAIAKLWDKIQLTFVAAMFVSDRPKSFGVYTPRETSQFKAGEDMFIYAEMVGYGFNREGDFFNIALKADTEVRTKDGKVLGGQKDFVTFTHKARVPAREFFAVITYNFNGISPGDYVVTTKLKDQNADQWASFDLPFTITE